MSSVEEKLKAMGLSVPTAPKPVAAYVPGTRCGDLIFTSGQLPSIDGQPVKGKLGADMTVEAGYAAAQISALNCLGVLKSMIGDLNRIEQIVKVVGFVNSTPDFEAQPKVINGASELLGEIFGEAGVHSRSAVGVNSLPLGACCEVEIIAKVKA